MKNFITYFFYSSSFSLPLSSLLHLNSHISAINNLDIYKIKATIIANKYLQKSTSNNNQKIRTGVFFKKLNINELFNQLKILFKKSKLTAEFNRI